MTILLLIGIPAAIYLLVAFGIYKWMMGSNPNTMQKSMSGFVVIGSLLWPLGLSLFAWGFITGRNKEQRP